jgi:hypothetical protein
MALFGGSQWHKSIVPDSYYYHWIASRAVNLGERGLDVTIVQTEANSLFAISLSTLYFVSTDLYFIGCLYSIFVWLLSAYVVKKILELLKADDKTKYLVFLFYAFLPSSIVSTSVPMREAFELLFINLIIYSALRVYLNKSSMHWIYLVISCFLLGQFHSGLYAFGPVVLLMLIMSNFLRNRRSFPIQGYIIAFPLIISLSVLGYGIFSDQVYDLENGLFWTIMTYQEGTLANFSRASYEPFIPGIEGPLKLVLFIPINLFQYLFQPMPWRISSILDIVLTFENMFRGFLIFVSIRGILKTDVISRRPLLFIFLAYLVIETIWSFGTTNWGTASRHHVPGLALLLIPGFYFYSKRSLNRKKMIPTE